MTEIGRRTADCKHVEKVTAFDNNQVVFSNLYAIIENKLLNLNNSNYLEQKLKIA